MMSGRFDQDFAVTTWVVVFMFILLGMFLGYILYDGRFRTPYPNIPIVYVEFDPSKKELSDDLLLLFRERGPVLQFLYRGKYALLVNDPKLLKPCLEIMDDYEHDDDPIAINVCTAVFGGTHNGVLRKNKRHRLHLAVWSGEKFKTWSESVIQTQLLRLCSFLDAFVDEGQSFNCQSFIGRFVLDTIYRECFEMDFNFMGNVASYHELLDAIEFLQQIVSNPDFDGILFTVQEKFQLIGTDTRKHKKLIEIHMLRVLDHLRLKQFNHTFQGESWGKHMMKMSVEDEFDTNSLLFEILLIIIKAHAPLMSAIVGIIYGLTINGAVQNKCGQLIMQHSTMKLRSPKPDSNALPDYVEGIIKESLRRFGVNNQYLVKVVDGNEYRPFSLSLQHLNEDIGLNRQRDLLPGRRYPDRLLAPENSVIIISLGCLHNDERNWGSGAFEFQPKRWTKSTSFNSITAYSGAGFLPNELCFLPFSMGVKRCGGMAPALLQIRSIVTTIYRQYQFTVDDDPRDQNALAPLQIKPFFLQASYI